MRLSVIAAWITVIMAGGCTVGPDYTRPDLQMPEGWSHSQSRGATTQPAGPTTRPTSEPCDIGMWWKRLDDPMLDSLIDRAIASNLDLRVATARVREARAQRNSTAAGLWPQIGSSAWYNYGGASLNTGASSSDGSSLLKDARNAAVNSVLQSVQNGQGLDAGQVASSTANQVVSNLVNDRLTDDNQRSHRGQNMFQAGFDASWEIDVFGGLRRGVEAADADIETSVEDQRAVLVSLVAEVALEYVQLRGYQRQLAIALKNIDTQRETLELTRQRFSAEFASGLEVAQARAQLSSTTSQVPLFQDTIDRSIYRLSILLGRPPGALVSELDDAAPIPASPPDVPIGLPSDLLRRRPDVRAAERQLAASTARIGEAIADLFPKFSLTGSFGSQTSDIQHLFDRNSLTWGVGPAVSWPIFEGGRIRANIDIQNARQEQALATYEQTVLTALNDVESALSAYAKEQVRRQSLQETVQASQQATELSAELYTRGMTAFLNVLEAQRALYASEDALVQSDTAIITDLIALYKALGGGWEG